MTLDRHIVLEEEMHPRATGNFSSMLHDFIFAIKIISRDIRRAGLNDVLGITQNKNVHGETVRKLDLYANEVIKQAMIQGGNVCAIASEEEKEIVSIDNDHKKSKYILVYDPLDGSTNIDVNITIGSIFSVYRRLDVDSTEPGGLADILQPGFKQVAAGYVLYGSSTMLVYTTGHGVKVFTYDPTLGDFLMINNDLRIPESGNIYSCNEGNYNKWTPEIQRYVDSLKDNSNGKVPYNLRYLATGVADIHRALHYGGIYMYPADTSNPEGKFRLVYEANALAMIVTAAGGMATDGKTPILEKFPRFVHERTPLIIGSCKEVSDYLRFCGNH